MRNETMVKCLNYALDRAVGDAEAKTAWVRGLHIARSTGLRIGDLARAIRAFLGEESDVQYVERVVVQKVPVERVVRRVVYRMPPKSMIVPWGRYKGRPLGEVFAQDPVYVEWIAKSANAANAYLKRAARDLCGGTDE